MFFFDLVASIMSYTAFHFTEISTKSSLKVGWQVQKQMCSTVQLTDSILEIPNHPIRKPYSCTPCFLSAILANDWPLAWPYYPLLLSPIFTARHRLGFSDCQKHQGGGGLTLMACKKINNFFFFFFFFFLIVFALGGSPTPHPISSRPQFVCKFSRHGSSSPVTSHLAPSIKVLVFPYSADA
jgi:hypothetical protein